MRRIFLSVVAYGLAAYGVAVSAQENPATVRPEKPTAILIQKRLPPLPPEKLWQFSAGASVTADSNINHLLIDSNIDSNARLPDTIAHSNAAVEFTPHWKDHVRADLSYGYDRFDFERHPLFSYYAHSLGALVYPRLGRSLELEAGGLFDWIGDNTGSVSNDQIGRAGLIWRAPWRLRLKAGYEDERLRVTADPLRNAHTNSFYAGFLRVLPRHQTLFATYYNRAHNAQAPDFSFHSQVVLAGLISHWDRGLKTTVLLSYADRKYDNVDDRFLQRRRDNLYGVTVKPAYQPTPWLEIYGTFTYLEDRSNVAIKRFYDQQVGGGLEISL